ncbi:MAG: hypothetical protein GYB65_23855 [Chloroflexi bacterium]|nr:hypothetical protein [Chloroflexota bacterium]
MEIIHAAQNMAIELGPTTWRMLNGTQTGQPGVLAALVEVTPGRIVWSPAFAASRALPREGLQPADVARVVVGWAPESENWHLGLLLAATPTSNYQMVWCGLASWPSGQANEHLTAAKLAGQSLARILDRPFHLVSSPKEPVNNLSETQPLQPTLTMAPMVGKEPQPSAEPAITPRKPPFVFEEWTMLDIPQGYVWQRRTRWRLGVALRVVGFTLASLLFFLLGIGAQSRGLASVKPEWLPGVGIVLGAVMLVLAAYNLWLIVMLQDVVVDKERREVRQQGWLTNHVSWRMPFEAVQYVLVSQVPARPQGRDKPGDPMRTAQEVWLHLYDGQRFYPIAELGRVDGLCHAWDEVRQRQKKTGRRPLRLADYDTPAHHAARQLTDVLETDTWLDVRA